VSYLYRLTGEVNGNSNCVTIPAGGMGQVSKTLADAARSAGVEILTDAPVGKIILTDGCASGAKLENGTVYEARKVVSNADPKTTFLKLVGAPNLEALFAHRVNNIRMKGTAAKLHLALNGLPKFNGLDEVQTGQRLIIAPSMKYVESAYDPVKYGEYSPEPAMEITIPTIHDDGLASQGNHVLSAIVQYTPYKLKKGWEGSRQAFIDMAIDRIATFAPGIRDHILHQELLTPADIEKEFRMTGGHWHHGEFAIDQLLIMRPVYGTAQYATPVDGLYLCGAGAHPGGGIMGAAGHNAAKAVLSGRKVA
jgi:phytoene dehydrogenase-like protein